MKQREMPAGVRRLLEVSAGSAYYPAVVGLIAFASTTTFAFPFAFVLIPAVFLAPRHWLLIGLLSGIASGLGGAVLVEVFHLMGRELVIARFPELVGTPQWQLGVEWLQRYGLVALAFIAGSPLPQTPAIFFYSLAEPSTVGVLLAVGAGKTVKYVFLAWLTARFPGRLFERACEPPDGRR